MKIHMTIRPLQPFGIEVTASGTHDLLAGTDRAQLQQWVAEHRVVVLRGFEDPSDERMLEFCRLLGSILEWEFGAVNELQVRDDARNYLYTNRGVPFHWDGAFVGKIPHFIFFHCRLAPSPGCGGETTFCDTTRLLQQVSPAERDQWSRVAITYSTERVVHYGGSFESPILARHPISGEDVVRFAEPVDDLNPVRLVVSGIPAAEQDAFLMRMHSLLHDPLNCLAHVWQQGDIVLADNHALLHGRRAFTQPTARHLRRVNIL